MRSKRWLLISLMSLPIIVLLGWFLYDKITIWETPAPRWITGKDSRTDLCQNIVKRTLSDVEPVTDIKTTRITSAQVSDIMERVIARLYGFVPLLRANPQLDRATFPDGQQRLFWQDWYLVSLSADGMDGKATVICVDAATGEPLMLIPEVNVGDPCMTCGCIGINLPFRRQQIYALGLLVIYLLILAVIGGIVWLRRRLVARRAHS